MFYVRIFFLPPPSLLPPSVYPLPLLYSLLPQGDEKRSRSEELAPLLPPPAWLSSRGPHLRSLLYSSPELPSEFHLEFISSLE